MDPNEWTEAQLAFVAQEYLKHVLEGDNPSVIASTKQQIEPAPTVETPAT